MVRALFLLLVGSLPALAHGEQLMAYPLSAVAAIGVGIWIVSRVLKKWRLSSICFIAIFAAIYECWERISPEPRSLHEQFVWWTLLLTAIPVLVGTATAFVLLLIERIMRMAKSASS
jgi:hypothetical protein